MPYYLCRIAADDGSVMTQSFLASSLKDCQRQFEEKGYCVLSVKLDWKRIQIPAFPFEKRIKDRDFIMFNQELVALIKAGYPILKSIGVILGRVKNVYLKELLMKIEMEVKGGKSLSEAFAPYERYFSRVYIASLMAGERSGNLAGTINRYIDYARVIAQTKSRIRSALTYPTLLLSFSFLMLGILISFILPRFSDFYSGFEASLPAITRALIAFSTTIKSNILLILALALVLILASLQMRRVEKTSILLDRIKLKIPYGGPIWLESSVALFCRTLGILLEAGITLLTASSIANKAAPNSYLIQKMSNLPEHIKEGESLSESILKAGFFPPLTLDMIRIGETSANLEGMLGDVADYYDERIQRKIDTLVSLIEPVVIIFMGLIVATMLLSVYLPIFNIIRIVR